MATTILDTLKKLGAATFDRLALLVGVVDDDPATYADGDVKPVRIHKTNRGMYVHLANPEDIGGGGGDGEVTQGDGSGTVAGFWTVRVSDGAAFIPFPTALVGGRFDANIGSWFGATTPTVGQKGAAASIPMVLANDAALPAGTNTIGGVLQGTGDTAKPWYILGLNGSTPERLATHALQGAGLPGAFTSGGGVKVGLVDVLPAGSNVIGKIEMAANAQADGHSVSIGATTDADTATTVIGRLKKLVSLLPAALVSGRFDINVGSWLGSTGAALGDNVSNPTSPLIGVAMMGFDRFSATSWNRWTMNQFGGVVQGYTGNGSALSGAERAIWIAGWDGANKRALLTDTSGRPSVTNNRIARTAHLTSATLPAAGAFTSQTVYTIPEGVVSITAYVTYTRGAAGGQVVLRPQWANGTETAYEVAVSGSAASGGTLRNQIELRELLGPVVNTASAVTFLVQFEVPAGCTTFALYAAEFGVTVTPGACAITLTARYGS